jgi:hypothetical protein
MTAASIAIAAAAIAVIALVAMLAALRRIRAHTRTLDAEIERGKASFDTVIAQEAEARAAELERTLARARADSLSALAEDERRVTEDRRRDTAERERDAAIRLADAVTEAQSTVEKRLSDWTSDLEKLQDGLADEFQRITQRQQQLSAEVETRLTQEAERLQAGIDEHRVLIARVREELDRATQEVAASASADLDQHSADRRRALHEVSDRLRKREHDLKEQIEREQTESMQRIAASLADIEQRQLEQVKRSVSREATRYSEAAAQQFETTIRAAREEAARRLGRELDLAVERFAREAEGVLAERVEHLAQGAVTQVEARLGDIRDDLDRQRDDALASFEQRTHGLETSLRGRIQEIATEAEAERAALDRRLHDLARRVDELMTRA